MAGALEHEPHGTHQTRKATASGWIGSAPEYYDFFIYATAASLIFPQLFFPQNIGTLFTALLPAFFATVAPPGSSNVPLTIGCWAFGVTVSSARHALSSRNSLRTGMCTRPSDSTCGRLSYRTFSIPPTDKHSQSLEH